VTATFLFAGPTLARALKIDPELPLAGVILCPPIKRGELPDLIRQHPPGRAVIVDGLFHTEVAVGHLEIRTAISRGWQLWGVSSMGVIRAREMASLGMRGFGEVYDLYCQEGVDFRDDEVTLMHGNAPDYQELSEPLVHIRVAVVDLVTQGILTESQGADLIGELEQMWYAERTLAWLATRLRQLAPENEARLPGFFDGFDRYRIKSLDLIRFLRSGLLAD
jgi:hypothetical protein